MGREAREKAITSRNFFRDAYRGTITILFFINVVTVVMLVLSFYFYNTRSAPTYYASSSIGGLRIIHNMADIHDPNNWVNFNESQ